MSGTDAFPSGLGPPPEGVPPEPITRSQKRKAQKAASEEPSGTLSGRQVKKRAAEEKVAVSKVVPRQENRKREVEAGNLTGRAVKKRQSDAGIALSKVAPLKADLLSLAQDVEIENPVLSSHITTLSNNIKSQADLEKAILDLMDFSGQNELSEKLQHIMEALKLLPSDQRAALFANIVSSFKGIIDTNQRAAILFALERMPHEQRAGAFVNIVTLLRSVLDVDLCAHILMAVDLLPPEKRADSLANIVILFQDIPNSNQRAVFLNILSSLPQEQRGGVLENSIRLFRQLPDSDDRTIILAITLTLIPPEQIAGAIANIVTIFQDISSHQRRVLLFALSLMPPEQIAEAVLHLSSFVKNISTEVHPESINQLLNLVPIKQRVSSLPNIGAIFKDISDRHQIAAIIRVLNAVAPEEIADLLADAIPFCCDLPDGDDRARIVESLGAFTAKQRDFLAYAAPFCRDINDGDQRLSILTAFHLTPQEQRADVAAHATPVCMAISNGYQRTAILVALLLTPQEQRGGARENIVTLSMGISNQYQLQFILPALSGIPEAQRADVMAHAAPIYRDIPDMQQRAAILETLGETVPEQRADVIRKADPFMAACDPIYKARILRSIKEIVDDHPDSVINDCSRWFAAIADPNLKVLLLEVVARTLQRPERDEALAQIASTNPQVAAEIRNLLGPDETVSVLRGAYRVELDREELRTIPLQVLHNLCKSFKEQIQREVKVAFIGEVGSDLGGLGRQFISELVAGLVDTMKFQMSSNALYRPMPTMKNNEFQPLSDEEKTAYNELGQLLMFCLNANKDYPIGMIFDNGVFSAILKFENEDLERSFDELIKDSSRFNDFFEIYQTLNSANEEDIKMILRMKTALAQASDKEKMEFAHDRVRPALAPLFEIAKGMKALAFKAKANWAQVQKMTPQELSAKLQGTVSKETILQKLRFSGDLPEEKREWIKEWIANTDDAKLQRFLFALTGAFALGNDATLKIQNVNSDSLFFHTCFNILDLPAGIRDKSMLFSSLDFAIKETGYSRA